MLRKLGTEVNKVRRIYDRANVVGHGWDHIREVIGDAKKFCKILDHEWNLKLEYAILFHDISLSLGYDRSVHEVESANIFREYAESKKFKALEDITPEEIDDICDIIKSHRASKTDSYKLTDINCAILGMADRGMPVKSEIAFANGKFAKLLACFTDKPDYIRYTCDYYLKKYGSAGYGYNAFYNHIFNSKSQEKLDKMVRLQKVIVDKFVARYLREVVGNKITELNSGSDYMDKCRVYELYQEYTKNGLTLPNFKKYIINNDNYKVWVVKRDRKIITGFIILRILNHNECEIDLVYVDKNYRSLIAEQDHVTYGDLLVCKAVDYASKHKFVRVMLYRDFEAKGLERFYKKLGFKNNRGAHGKSIKMVRELI